MGWHYQIRKSTDQGGDWHDIVEVYDMGSTWSWTQDGMKPGGETPELLINDLEAMLADAKKYPVFEEPHDD